MNGQSPDIKQDSVAKLREMFPHVFSEGKIDLEKFKATFCDDIDFRNERYTLNWAGKADAFRILQERTSATLKPQPSLSVNFDTAENVFIEGENLEVLKILQKSYYNKIKCIIIDPPYNTGNDSFIYPDRFKENLEDYEKRVGEKDEEGYLMKEGLFRKNSRENGHYHSNWLSMMLPRLFLARNLLRDDGVIFVHIDDNEVHNLRLVMNEVFGEENFVAQLVWQNKTGAGAKSKGFIGLHEYIICYAKTISNEWDVYAPMSEKMKAMYNKIDERGAYATWPLDTTSMDERPNLKFPIYHDGVEIWPSKQWLWSKERVEKAQIENRLVINFNEKLQKWTVRFKGYLNDESGNCKQGKPTTMFIGPYTQEGTKNFSVFFDRDVFDFPKPVELIKQLLSMTIGTDLKDSIILDFFGGSGTTAQAVMELNAEDGGNRKFILVQLPELCDESTEAHKAGYKTIADISRERIRRVIQKLGDNVGFKSFKLSPSNFKVWRSDEVTAENLEQQMEMFIDPVKPESETENILVELMLKSGYQLTDHIENMGNFYRINNELIIALTEINPEITAEIISHHPQKVITLDRLFAGNDELKTNTALQMRDAGVEFRVV
jgi:adenine-specific DNA-methyltransferase